MPVTNHESVRAPAVLRRLGVAVASLLGALALAVTVLPASSASAASKSTSKSASKSSSKSKSSGAKSSSTVRKAMAKFQKCLSSHGVKLPSFAGGGQHFHHSATSSSGGTFGHGGTFPHAGTAVPAGGGPGPQGGGGFGGFGGSTSKTSKAFSACKGDLPKGAGFGFGGPGGQHGTFKPTPTQQAALTKFDQCMTSHGVKIASNSTFETIRKLEQADPAAKAAAQTCSSDLQGVFGPHGGSTTTTG